MPAEHFMPFTVAATIDFGLVYRDEVDKAFRYLEEGHGRGKVTNTIDWM